MALKACRNQIAKAQASRLQDPIEPPPLAYRKWRLVGQENIYDIVNCGMVTSSVFDRLVSTSLSTDSRSVPSSSLSGTRKFITSGKNPFIGWYELKEENTTPHLSEVALNVASKLTTAVISSISSATSDWLGFGIPSRFKGQPAKDAKPANPPVEVGIPIKLRYGLPDKRRQAESIVLSPDGSLAACTDDFGRILIISNESGLIVRMLKGYREAQCGWIIVDDRSDEHANVVNNENKIRQTLFLVIYAPRRGILEIWLAEQGNRVGAFNVGKDCRLLYNSHGTLGSRAGSNGMLSNQSLTCYLIEGNGNLSSINVPFHCSLSLLHSLRARDSFLLRKVSGVLEKGFSSSKKDDQLLTLKQLLQEMEAPETLLQAVRSISSCQKLSSIAMSSCIAVIKETLEQRAEQMGIGDDIEYLAEIKGIISLCDINFELIKLFDSLNELHQRNITTAHDEITSEELLHSLDLPSNESEIFNDTLCKLERISVIANTPNADLTTAEFLDFFTYDSTGNSEIPREPITVFMKIADDNDCLGNLASLYFEPYLEHSIPISELDILVNSRYADTETCMCMLVTYCKNRSISSPKKLNVIRDIMLCFVDDVGLEEDHTKSILEFWRPARSILENCTSVGSCLLLAYICKSVSLKKQKDQSEEQNSTQVKWNDIEKDIREWDDIIAKLEDLFTLESFLNMGYYYEASITDENRPKLLIREISKGGKGAVTQITAAHIVRCRIPGPCVANLNSEDETSELTTCDTKRTTDNQHSEILEALRDLQTRFPCSLEQDALLAHCCWECILLWKEDVEDVSILSSAVVHLSTISSAILKQGLALLFWKAIFKESIKNVHSLIEKIGKSPKDRLCRKHIGMSINATEKYLFTACSLLRQILQAQDDSSNIDFPEFQIEKRWESNSRNNSSIIDSALDEAKCDRASVKNMWNMATVLRFIVFTGMKSIVTSRLFQPEEIRASVQLFPSPCKLPKEPQASLENEQLKFCRSALSLLVERLSAAEEDEEQVQGELLSSANEIFALCNNFNLDDDILWQHFTCSLFSAGLDYSGYEALLSVHQKDDLVEPLLDICRSRLARTLIDANESSTRVKVISSLPTHITSWLQVQAGERKNTKTSTVKENVKLLNSLLAFKSTRKKFIKDLIDSLEIFL